MFRITEESESVDVLGYQRSAIKLLGYDRPSRIEGLSDIPDPLYVIESFSDEDLAQLSKAYEADRKVNKAERSGLENSVAYLRHRLGMLPEEDRKIELMAEISSAQKISDYVLEFALKEQCAEEIDRQEPSHKRRSVISEDRVGRRRRLDSR